MKKWHGLMTWLHITKVFDMEGSSLWNSDHWVW